MPTGSDIGPFRSDTIVQKINISNFTLNPLVVNQFNFYKTINVPTNFNGLEIIILTDSHTQLLEANAIIRNEIRPNEFVNKMNFAILLPSNLFAAALPRTERLTIGLGTVNMLAFNSATYNPDLVTLLPDLNSFFGAEYNTAIPLTFAPILALRMQGVDATVDFDITLFITFFRA